MAPFHSKHVLLDVVLAHRQIKYALMIFQFRQIHAPHMICGVANPITPWHGNVINDCVGHCVHDHGPHRWIVFENLVFEDLDAIAIALSAGPISPVDTCMIRYPKN